MGQPQPYVGGAPFEATPGGARALVVDVAAEGARIGNRAPRIGDDTVAQWLDSAAGQVAARLWGYDKLTPGLAQQVEQAAKGLVEMYAAAMLADANHPERAGGQYQYGRLLMDRFNTELNQLAAWVQQKVTAYEQSGEPDPGLDPRTELPASAARFPGRDQWRFTRYTRF